MRTRASTLRRMFATRRDPYAGADLDNARRLGALLWGMVGTLSLALFSLSPPTAQLEGTGWFVGGAVVASCFGGARWLVWERFRPNFDELLGVVYLMIVQIAALEWLAGGGLSAYENLYLIPIVFAAGLHPPRRVLLVLLAVAVAAALPLAYGDWSRAAAGDVGIDLILWFAFALAMMALMVTVRRQRLTLRAEEEHAQKLARVDSLTGLGNRRAFDEALEAEITHARRTGRPLSVVILDIDEFKQINDGFGHLNGDRCLRQVAKTLTSVARAADSCYRWGGDEFAVLLRETGYDGALNLSGRLRASVTEACVRPDGDALTITCGTAELTEAANADDFLAAADLALMSLKRPSETEPRPADAGGEGSFRLG